MKRANLTVPEKLKMQRDGYKFFCEHHKTANCAIGENIGLTCVHAPNHKTREGCRYWKPVHIERRDELICLRADLAAVTAERDRMREALRPIAFMARAIPVGLDGREKADYQTVDVTCGDLRRARAALEGVTEPASPWRDIESAPKDGTHIDLWVNGERIPDARWNDRQRRWEVWSLGDYDGMEFVPIAGNPTHWMPLPEPPQQSGDVK